MADCGCSSAAGVLSWSEATSAELDPGFVGVDYPFAGLAVADAVQRWPASSAEIDAAGTGFEKW